MSRSPRKQSRNRPKPRAKVKPEVKTTTETKNQTAKVVISKPVVPTRLRKSWAKAAARLRRIPTYVTVWALLLLSAAGLGLFSATTSGVYSNHDIYEVTFDHLPSQTEFAGIIDKSGLSVNYSDLVVDGTYLSFRTKPDHELRPKLAEALKKAPGAVTANGYYTIPINPLPYYLPVIAVYFAIFALVSLLTLWVALRGQERSYRLKTWVALLILPSMGGLILGALGVSLSQLQLIKFTPASWDLYLGALAVLTIASTYFVIKEDTRDWLLGRLFSK
jgi:hypothetical protein